MEFLIRIDHSGTTNKTRLYFLVHVAFVVAKNDNNMEVETACCQF